MVQLASHPNMGQIATSHRFGICGRLNIIAISDEILSRVSAIRVGALTGQVLRLKSRPVSQDQRRILRDYIEPLRHKGFGSFGPIITFGDIPIDFCQITYYFKVDPMINNMWR